MNRIDIKAARIRQHLSSHPHDYQSVVSLFKIESDSIVYDRRQKKNRKMAEVAKYRRESDEKHT